MLFNLVLYFNQIKRQICELLLHNQKLGQDMRGNMVTNMTGSSILKSTGHTGWVKPVNLSVRFILGDSDPNSDEISDTASEDS